MSQEFGRLIGGRLGLDFVNTVGGREWSDGARRGRSGSSEIIREGLTSYDALVRWGVVAGATTEREARRLRRLAGARPAAATGVLRRAVAVREALYRLFSAAIEERPIATSDLALLDEEARIARVHQRLVASPHFGWRWDDRTRRLDRVLWPAVASAVELLTGDELERVGECPGDNCGWLFLDTSRSRRRQWCDMATCGNLAKVHRFRERQRSG